MSACFQSLLDRQGCTRNEDALREKVGSRCGERYIFQNPEMSENYTLSDFQKEASLKSGAEGIDFCSLRKELGVYCSVKLCVDECCERGRVDEDRQILELGAEEKEREAVRERWRYDTGFRWRVAETVCLGSASVLSGLNRVSEAQLRLYPARKPGLGLFLRSRLAHW